MSSFETPLPPPPEERLPVTFVSAPHPAIIDIDELTKACEFRNQARSGPGGQHRNRTASGVFVTYRPAEITAEATEQRSQHRNRDVAVSRLRYLLAVSLRSPSYLDEVSDRLEVTLRAKYRKSSLKLAEGNFDKPGLLALILNDLHAAGGQPSLVGQHWETPTSRISSLLRSHPPSWQWVNRVREHHGRRPLR